MTPYDPNAKCPKCGSADIGVRYRMRHRPECGEYGETVYRCIEKLDRTCRNCRHQMESESCLDAKPNEDG